MANEDETPSTGSEQALEATGARPPSIRRRTLTLATLISLAVAVLLIVFLLARFDIDLGDTWRKARDAQPGLLAAAFAVYYLTFPLRGYRWRVLLDNARAWPDPASPKPGPLPMGEMVLISWFVNSITWLRLGDAYRAYNVASRFGISFSTSVGTVVAERAVDIGIVAALLLVAGVGLLRGGSAEEAGAVLVGATGVAGAAALALLTMRLFGVRIARFLPRRLQRAYTRFEQGTLGGLRRLPLLIALSAAIWLMESARLYLVVEALDLDVSLSLVLFAALAHSLLTTIPFTPGGLGFVELGLTGLLALELPRDDAAGITLLDRSITYLSIVVIGGALFALRQAVSMRRAAAKRAPKSEAE